MTFAEIRSTSFTVYRRLNFACLIFLAFLIVWLVFLEPPYLSYTNLPFPVLTPIVTAGNPVEIFVQRCNTDTVPHVYFISHTLNGEDGSMEKLDPSNAPIQPGCHEGVSRVNVIPKCTKSGTYSLSGFGFSEATIRTVAVRWQSKKFQVIALTPRPIECDVPAISS